MAVQLELKNYHHMVILAGDCREAVVKWAKIFDFPVPRINETGKHRDAEAEKAYQESGYPCLYRGNWWHTDFLQAVFPQKNYFFEINGTGHEKDCFTEYQDRRGAGICYIGIVAGEKRDSFIEYADKELGCETVVEQKIMIPGWGVVDWTVVELDSILGTNVCVKQDPGGAHTADPSLPDFAGMMILVPDVEKAAAGWEKIFSDVRTEITVQNVEITSERTEEVSAVKTAEISGGRFPILLVEPDAGPFREYVDKHGFGNYCIAFSENDGSRAKALYDNGMKTLYSMKLSGKTFKMFDTLDEMGTVIALV